MTAASGLVIFCGLSRFGRVRATSTKVVVFDRLSEDARWDHGRGRERDRAGSVL
jgi:hypothetical protein